MSKKSKRQTAQKEQAARQRTEMRKPSVRPKKPSAAPLRQSGAARAFARASQSARSLNPANLLYIRIAAIALAVLALATGISWGLSTRGAVTPWMVAGMVLLGLIAGFCLLIAVRTEDIVRRARQAARR